MHGLENGAENLQAAGVRRIWIDGSFVTTKKEPKDVDGCWEYTENVDIGRLDPVFLAESRLPMKEKYGVEFFPAFVIEAGSGLPFPKILPSQSGRRSQRDLICLLPLKDRGDYSDST